jgi:hypothetical protein
LIIFETEFSETSKGFWIYRDERQKSHSTK